MKVLRLRKQLEEKGVVAYSQESSVPIPKYSAKDHQLIDELNVSGHLLNVVEWNDMSTFLIKEEK